MNLQLLDKNYDISSINIEVEKSFNHLKDFLLVDGKKYINSKLCSIYGVFEKDKIVGYISISASMLRLKESFFNKIEINDLNDISIPIPGILIGKLLVSKEYRNKGYGNNLIIAIMSYCYDISQKIGIRFIIVDANKNAIGFYKKHGFIELSDNSETTKMVFDLKQFD